MTGKEYQDLAFTTANKELGHQEQVLNALLGLSGETGEIADIYKKHYFQGHELSLLEVEKEIGDVLWYVALLCTANNLDMSLIMELNIEKLKARYPEGFEASKSINRKDK